MTDPLINPLLGRRPTKPGRVTADQLQDRADHLNRQDWVRARGWHYYVGETSDGLASLERSERGGFRAATN